LKSIKLIGAIGVIGLLFFIVLFIGFGYNTSAEFQGIAEIVASIAGFVFNAVGVIPGGDGE